MPIIRPYTKQLYSKWSDKPMPSVNLSEATNSLFPSEIIHHVEIENKASNAKYLKGDYDKMHPLIQAAHMAYYDHLPLVITPDTIWHCIASAVAIHVNKHAEELRSTFVDHEGQKEIEIVRPDFQLGQKNPWNEMIDEFAEKIKEHTKKSIGELMQADFSTTTKISRVASQIVLMDAMKSYFRYSCCGGCGIPEIRLTGEKSDWLRVKSKADQILAIIPAFKEWMRSLHEILDEFINVFDNKVDKFFWKSLYTCSFYFLSLFYFCLFLKDLFCWTLKSGLWIYF